jgi:hypothetical protein
MVIRPKLLALIAPLVLTITACSRPQIEVLAPSTTARGAERLADCMQTYTRCDDVRSDSYSRCRRIADSDPSLLQHVLHGPGGIACSAEERALAACRPELEECLRRAGALLTTIDSDQKLAKPVDFARVKTQGTYLFVFEQGLKLSLPNRGEDLTLTFARKVRRVSTKIPATFSDNRVSVPSLPTPVSAEPALLVVTLDDGSTCAFELQELRPEPINTREYTFDCLGSTEPVAPLPSPPPEPPIVVQHESQQGWKAVEARGWHSSRFEASNFSPCSSEEGWWFGIANSEARAVLSDIRQKARCQGPHCSYPIFVRGTLSPRGRFGHMGMYQREILATEVRPLSESELEKFCGKKP